MRELIAEYEENQDRRAKLAIDAFCDRVRRYIGAYLCDMGEVSAIVFTGGIGENSAFIRKEIIKNMDFFGISIDPEKNSEVCGREGVISKENSKVEIHVIPTNEELLIARDAFRAVESK